MTSALVLAFDTRAGVELKKSGKETDCLYDAACMAVDVLAAVRYLRASGATTVSVIGGSAGGGAVAQASIEAKRERSTASCCWRPWRLRHARDSALPDNPRRRIVPDDLMYNFAVRSFESAGSKE